MEKLLGLKKIKMPQKNKTLREDLQIEKVKATALINALSDERAKVAVLENDIKHLKKNIPNVENDVIVSININEMKEKLKPYMYKKLQEQLKRQLSDVVENMILDTKMDRITFPDVEDINRKIEKLEDWKNDIDNGFTNIWEGLDEEKIMRILEKKKK